MISAVGAWPRRIRSAASTRMTVGATAVIATRASRAATVPVECHERRRTDDRDLHRRPVLEPQVRAPDPAGGSRRDDDARRAAPRVPGSSVRGRRGTRRPGRSANPAAERSSTEASKTSNGDPVSIAGEALHRLPPSVPRWRVAGEPTRADESERADQRSRTERGPLEIGMGRQGADAQPAIRGLGELREPGQPVDRDDGLWKRLPAAPGRDDEVGAARDHTGARAELGEQAERVVERGRRVERPRRDGDRH